jgi:hypothetical protein
MDKIHHNLVECQKLSEGPSGPLWGDLRRAIVAAEVAALRVVADIDPTDPMLSLRNAPAERGQS